MEIQNYCNYLIYDDGRVYSKNKNTFLKQHDNGNGYKWCWLYNNGKKKHFYIHILVGLHYLPNPNDYPTIDHINRKRNDNRVENLRWATRTEQNYNKDNDYIRKDNTAGYRYIGFRKDRNEWTYQNRKYKIYKRFNDKIDVLCYKFIIELKIKTINK